MACVGELVCLAEPADHHTRVMPMATPGDKLHCSPENEQCAVTASEEEVVSVWCPTPPLLLRGAHFGNQGMAVLRGSSHCMAQYIVRGKGRASLYMALSHRLPLGPQHLFLCPRDGPAQASPIMASTEEAEISGAGHMVLWGCPCCCESGGWSVCVDVHPPHTHQEATRMITATCGPLSVLGPLGSKDSHAI